MTRNEMIALHNAQQLYDILAKKGVEVDSMEGVLANLKYLASEKTVFGNETTRWIPLPIKKLIVKALDPDCRIEYKTLLRNGKTLGIEATFFWSDSETPAGTAYVQRDMSFPLTTPENASREENDFEALVRGSVTTRVITEAGIGIGYTADEFDFLFEQVEEAEALRKKERKNSDAPVTSGVPEVKPANSRKRGAAKNPLIAKAEEEAKAEVKAEEKAEETTKVPVDTTEKPEAVVEDTSAKEENPTAEPKVAMSVDEAAMQIVELGSYKGQPLGFVESVNPKALVWLVKRNDATKKAALVMMQANKEKYGKALAELEKEFGDALYE